MQDLWKPSLIEDYAIIGDTHTAALVSKHGSIDWLCLPRFDSPACLASLLGEARHGHWTLRPRGGVREVRRQYRGDTLILETTFRTDEGQVTLIDFMPYPSQEQEVDVMRIVRGDHGSVQMRMELVLRFDYGAVVPWVRRTDYGLRAYAGPNGVELRTPVRLTGENLHTVSEFTVSEGEAVPFTLTWHPSHVEPPVPIESFEALKLTEQWWTDWISRYEGTGEWAQLAKRSLLTLKALTYEPTGGIVAAPTTSLPEHIGGVRNWDYRYTWLRDATFTLYALLISGFEGEARAWHNWLLRATAGVPSQLQIMYGVAGERLLPEFEADWLPGYEGSSPVRLGNAAHRQLQLDVFGEIMDLFHVARRSGLEPDEDAWLLQVELLNTLEQTWQLPDEGIWEVRSGAQHFTHSKVMAWVAADRAVKAVDRIGLRGPRDRWAKLRDTIHAEVLERGFDTERGTFVQAYGSREVDAALLTLPLVGFLPATDPRIQGTIKAIQEDLLEDGFVRRYRTGHADDGLPAGEGVFLPCSFWLADALVLSGRRSEAVEIFERLTGICNDVGLLAEEYDPKTGRQLGNFPQAFTHVGLINTANNLAERRGPAEQRAQQTS